MILAPAERLPLLGSLAIALYFLVSIMTIFSNGAHEQVGLKNGKFFLFANNIVSRLRSTHRPILDLEVASFAFSRVSIGLLVIVDDLAFLKFFMNVCNYLQNSYFEQARPQSSQAL